MIPIENDVGALVIKEIDRVRRQLKKIGLPVSARIIAVTLATRSLIGAGRDCGYPVLTELRRITVANFLPVAGRRGKFYKQSVMLAASCEGQAITTIEGVSEHGSLAAIQKAYGDWGGAQCGFCTPGFIMTVKFLLSNNSDPTEAEVRRALSSNLCRCTGYSQMYQAIKSAIEAEQKGTSAVGREAV
jgi:hypothetical protein